MQYSQTSTVEAPARIPAAQPPADWPTAGAIELTGLVVRYRPSLPPVLKGVTLSICGREKVLASPALSSGDIMQLDHEQLAPLLAEGALQLLVQAAPHTPCMLRSAGCARGALQLPPCLPATHWLPLGIQAGGIHALTLLWVCED